MADGIAIETPIDGVRTIRLDRPDALNAFTFSMYGSLLAALEEIAIDPTVRVVLLTGTGRAFCAGHDLRAAGAPPMADAGLGKPYLNRATMTALNRIPIRMRTMPQPIICAVNGVTAGIGYTLALASDMAIASRSARFVNTIHNAATGTELGLSYLLPRAIGTQRAAEILLTARPVLAEEAERIGLVLRMVENDALIETCLEIARAIMRNVPIGIALTKQSLWMNQSIASLDVAVELEGRAVAIAQSTEDAAEKRASFLEKRDPLFRNR